MSDIAQRFVPGWVNQQADEMVTVDLEGVERLQRAFEATAAWSRDAHTIRVDWPRQHSHRKLIELQDSINAMWATFEGATRTQGLMTQSVREHLDDQYRDVLEVARKAPSVTARDGRARIGQHSAWLAGLAAGGAQRCR